MKKSLIATITTAMFVLSLLAPVMLTQKAYAVAPDPASWYMKVDGVLDTDYYSLYPYKAGHLELGFSKFGELIDNNTNVGLEYNHDRDPWAEPAGSSLDLQKLPKKVWINGWFLDITYNHSSWGLRNLWAGALFGDLSDYGKPWLHVQAPQSCTFEYQETFLKPGYEINDAGAVTGTVLMNGGRKTNASATTDPITVLYHGPRKFIAQLETHIWDIYALTNATLNVVNVMFTIIFDKVSKEVIVYKEVKVVDQAKYQISPLRVTVGTDPAVLDVPFGILCQFSNREEWDLGTNLTTPKYASYVHFYTQGTAIGDNISEGLYTPYDELYTVLPTLPANTSVVGQRLGGNGTNAWGPEPYPYQSGGTYDVAQIISNDKKYVGFAAYWPSLSDWSADAGGGRRDQWYRAIGLDEVHDIDSFATPNDEPFLAPLTVGEWDFMLADDHKTVGPITADIHFRGVSVYGLTDLNDGTDNNFIGSPRNWIDREVMYQLQQVFAPWDLESVLEKKDYGRWVTKYDGDGEATVFYLKYSDLFPIKGFTMDWPSVTEQEFAWYYNFDGYYNLDQSSYDWTGYNYDRPNFGERVLVDGVLMERDVDYIVDSNDLSPYYMFINFTEPPALDAEIKILFSATNHEMNGGQWEWEVVGKDSNSIDSEGAPMVANFLADRTANIVQMTGSEMQNTAYGPLAPYILDPLRTALLPDKRGYRDAEISFNHGRLALKDDWSCHKDESSDWLYGIPIASSNIITVGGPTANLATEYTNDFTDAFATIPGWTGAGLPTSAIFAASCWSKNTYVPQYGGGGAQTVGYGLISTVRDINGTVWFVVYGYTGQDTYYTTWALLHSDVLHLAWDLMPSGVTTLILEFDYTLHPTDYCFVTIKEALGTISEFDAQECFLEHMRPSAPQQTAAQIWLPFLWWPETWVTDKFPTIHKDP